MDRISYNSLKIINFFENLNPKTSGVIFSTLIHLIILLFMVGLPNFFSPKEIFIPNIIPIEILNVDENTNLKKLTNVDFSTWEIYNSGPFWLAFGMFLVH